MHLKVSQNGGEVDVIKIIAGLKFQKIHHKSMIYCKHDHYVYPNVKLMHLKDNTYDIVDSKLYLDSVSLAIVFNEQLLSFSFVPE